MSRKETARCAQKAEPIPTFASEAEERRFWESDDSTDHVDWGRAERVRLPQPQSLDTSISLRPVSLLKRIKMAPTSATFRTSR